LNDSRFFCLRFHMKGHAGTQITGAPVERFQWRVADGSTINSTVEISDTMKNTTSSTRRPHGTASDATLAGP
jgi:hypothetical protein